MTVNHLTASRIVQYITGEGAGAHSDFIDLSGASRTLKHDPLADADRGMVTPSDDTTVASGEWASAGACTLFRDSDGVWYVALRQRTSDTAGRDYELHKNTGDVTLDGDWTPVWDQNMDNVNANLTSIERCCLREYGGTYYFYFCYAEAGWGSDGRIAFVTGASPADIVNQLGIQSNWTTIAGGASPGKKDPDVWEFQGNYYMMAIDGDGIPAHIYKSDTPDFAAVANISDPQQPYLDTYAPDIVNTGTVHFDSVSGQWFHWGTARHSTDIYWYWTVSDDLITWSLYDRSLEYAWGRTANNTARYFQLWQLDDQRSVVAMEWDDDGDGIGETYVWDYSTDTAGESGFSRFQTAQEAIYQEGGVYGPMPTVVYIDSGFEGGIGAFTAAFSHRSNTTVLWEATTAQANGGTQSARFVDPDGTEFGTGKLYQDIGSSDFEAEVWFRSDPVAAGADGEHGQYVYLGQDISTGNDIYAGVRNGGGTNNPEFTIIDHSGGSTGFSVQSSAALASNWTKDKWLRLEVLKNGTTVDVSYDEDSAQVDAATFTLTNDTDTLCGVGANMGGGQDGNLYFDDLRVANQL